MKTILPFTLSICMLLSSQVMATCLSTITSTNPYSVYANNGDGTVTDKQTGLMWQQCSLGLSGTDCTSGTIATFTWQAALATANSNTGNGYSDWRLPNINELASLTEDACSAPTTNETLFPATASSYYWSSSPYNLNDFEAWNVNFDNGVQAASAKNDSYAIRLVRGSN